MGRYALNKYKILVKSFHLQQTTAVHITYGYQKSGELLNFMHILKSHTISELVRDLKKQNKNKLQKYKHL